MALQLVAETALTPYWPGLLRDLFGTRELAATGTFLTVCRIVGLAALPLWGLAARRWPLQRLIVTGLVLAAACDVVLALAPTLWLFTLASAGSVATGSALVLAYPALVEVLDRRKGPAGGGDPRTGAVVLYTAVFHVAAVLATVIGAAVVSLPEPRIGLLGFAVADLVLAALVLRHVPVDTAAAGPAAPAAPAGAAAVAQLYVRVGRRGAWRAIALVAALAVVVDLGTTVARPFFLELVLAEGGSLALGAALFLLPSVGALLALPGAAALARRRPGPLLPGAALLAAGGLGLQAAAAGALPAMVTGRILLGLGLGALAIAVDLRIFTAVGTSGSAFASVETARSVALLAAPILATIAVAGGLRAPLVVGALLFCLAAVPVGRARGHRTLRPCTDPARAGT